MKKKITILLAGTMLVASLFTGCGKKEEKIDVTADELMTAALEQLNSDKYNSIDGKGDVAISIDAGAMMGSGSTGTYMDITLNLDYNTEQDVDTQHTEVTMNTNFMGSNQVKNTKTWEQKDGDVKTVYDYNEDTGEWTYTTEQVEDGNAFTKDMISDADVEKDGDGYKLTGKIDVSKAMNSMDTEGALDQYSQYQDMLKGMVVNIEMTFDGEKNLKGIVFSVGELDVNGFKITKFEINATFKELGTDKQIDVPADIVENAVSDDFDWDDDDIDDNDDTEDGSGDVDDDDFDDDFDDFTDTEDISNASPEAVAIINKVKALSAEITDEDFLYYVDDDTEGFEIKFDYSNGDSKIYIIYERYPEGSVYSAQATYDEYAKEAAKTDLEASFGTEYEIVGSYDDKKTMYYINGDIYPCEVFLCGDDYVMSITGYLDCDSIDEAKGAAFIEEMNAIVASFGF